MDVEKIESDWTTFQSLAQKLENDNINQLIEDLSERIIMCPASPRTDNKSLPSSQIRLSDTILPKVQKMTIETKSNNPSINFINLPLPPVESKKKVLKNSFTP